MLNLRRWIFKPGEGGVSAFVKSGIELSKIYVITTCSTGTVIAQRGKQTLLIDQHKVCLYKEKWK